MLFGARKNPFAASAEILAAEGFTDKYISALESDCTALKKPRDIVLGRSYLVNALVMRGRLSEAYESFCEAREKLPLKKLEPVLMQNMLHNVIFSLFIRDKFKEADELYSFYNAEVLSEPTSTMKRTLAIHECMNERYENAVTVLAKLLDSECKFLDLCIVKTLLKLDMFERAGELSCGFDKYNGCGELEAEANKLKKKIQSGMFIKSKIKKKK